MALSDPVTVKLETAIIGIVACWKGVRTNTDTPVCKLLPAAMNGGERCYCCLSGCGVALSGPEITTGAPSRPIPR